MRENVDNLVPQFLPGIFLKTIIFINLLEREGGGGCDTDNKMIFINMKSTKQKDLFLVTNNIIILLLL